MAHGLGEDGLLILEWPASLLIRDGISRACRHCVHAALNARDKGREACTNAYAGDAHSEHMPCMLPAPAQAAGVTAGERADEPNCHTSPLTPVVVLRLVSELTAARGTQLQSSCQGVGPSAQVNLKVEL